MIEDFEDIVREVEEKYHVSLIFGPKNKIRYSFTEDVLESEQKRLQHRIYRELHHRRQEAKKWRGINNGRTRNTDS